MNRLIRISLLSLLLVVGSVAAAPAPERAGEGEFRVLVFSATAGFRHGSIEAGREAIAELGRQHRFVVEATEEPSIFTKKNLENVQVVVFLNTTGTLFEPEQREAIEEFIRAGGGFVGIHSAADTEYEWGWYGKLVGAYFQSHPRIQEAVIRVEDRDHPATAHLSAEWTRTDEWYNFRSNPRGEVRVLMSLDTGSFEGSEMEEDHPIAWCHTEGRGRAFYTGLGHTTESYSEPLFLEHLLGAICWAGKRN